MRAKDFYKRVDGHEWFDYDKIEAEGFPINVIISERGQKGKTYGLKEHIFKQFLEHPEAKETECLWLRSQKSDVEIEQGRFLNTLPPNMDAVSTELRINKDNISIGEKPLFYFKSVSSPNSIRGTRTIFNHVVWDEFNDSINRIRTSLVENFSNILMTADNPVRRSKSGANPMKAWLLGNNRGLNHPFLISLGVEYIEEEVTKMYDIEGNPFVLIICPKYDEDDIQQMSEEKKNDWLFQLNVQTGMADHIYFNKTTYDETNFVQRFIELEPSEEVGRAIDRLINKDRRVGQLELIGTFLIDGQHINFYRINTNLKSRNGLNTKYHVINLGLLVKYWGRRNIVVNEEDYISQDKQGNRLIFTTNRLELKEGVNMLPTSVKKELIKFMSKDEVSFENTTSRANFISLIRR